MIPKPAKQILSFKVVARVAHGRIVGEQDVALIRASCVNFGQLAQVRVEEDDSVGLLGRHQTLVLGHDAVGELAVDLPERELVVQREAKVAVPRVPQQDFLHPHRIKRRSVDALDGVYRRFATLAHYQLFESENVEQKQ